MNTFIKRFQSFLWRFGGALVTFGLAWIAENIGLLELPIYVQGILSLMVGELTKWFNGYQSLKGRTFLGGIK